MWFSLWALVQRRGSPVIFQGGSLTDSSDSLVSDGRCKHYTKSTHTSHFRRRDFSRLTQDFSHRVNRNRCVSQNSHSSHLARHVTRALVVVSFTLEHYLIFQLHSYTLQRSVECVFRPSGLNALAYKLWTHRSHWRGHLCTGQTDVLPQTEYDVDLWFSWEHCDSPSWSGFGWWTNTEYAGFTAVLTVERSKCRPITRQCRETCRSCRTQKKAESRDTFQQKRSFIGTSTCSRRRWSSIQTLWIGKCCETSLWRRKRSSSRRGKLGTCRREQASLHEELAQRDRALRETHIKSIHEVGKLQRAQEMQIDELSRNDLWESHATIQKLTSQIQELQDRVRLMSVFWDSKM